MVSTIAAWKQTLPAQVQLFAQIRHDNPNPTTSYRLVMGAALLWAIRDASAWHLLAEVLPDDDQRAAVLHALANWTQATPLEALQQLAQTTATDSTLDAALNTLLIYFLDDLIAGNVLNPHTTHTAIGGDVSGVITNINGVQYFAGDVFLQYIAPSAVNSEPQLRVDHYTHVVETRLHQRGFTVDRDVAWQGDTLSLVGAGRLGSMGHYLWIMLAVFPTITLGDVQAFSKSCRDYAHQHKSRTLQLENNFIVAVALVNQVDPITREALRESSPKQPLWGDTEMPVVVSLGDGQVMHSTQTPLLMVAYLPYLREQTDAILNTQIDRTG